MSVQSTIKLTRREAEYQLSDKRYRKEQERIRKLTIVKLTNEELAQELEDEFHNFLIKDN